MRYTNVKSFERHLMASAPHHFCRFYLVASSDEWERSQIVRHIVNAVQGRDASPVRFVGEGGEFPQILEALCVQPLFDQEPIILIENAEKALLQALLNGLEPARSFGFLLIGTQYKEGLALEKQGVILDLLGERPWEREKRWIEQLQERAGASGKRLAPDAAAWMLENLEPSYALLSQELDKLLCFCATKDKIERSDAAAISVRNRSLALWTVAEEMIWEQSFRLSEWEVFDSFHALLTLLRQQCMIGVKMGGLLRAGIPFTEWSSYFPKLWPKVLEKRAQKVPQLGEAYFRKGLDLLFQIDVLSKSSAVPLDVLLDLFRVQLRIL
jgi:DNA polymerase III delta subunit